MALAPERYDSQSLTVKYHWHRFRQRPFAISATSAHQTKRRENEEIDVTGYLSLCCTEDFLRKHVRPHIWRPEKIVKKTNEAAVKRRQSDQQHRNRNRDAANINTILLIPEHVQFDIARKMERRQDEFERLIEGGEGKKFEIRLATKITYRAVIDEGEHAQVGTLNSLVVGMRRTDNSKAMFQGRGRQAMTEMTYKAYHLFDDQFQLLRPRPDRK